MYVYTLVYVACGEEEGYVPVVRVWKEVMAMFRQQGQRDR